MANEQRTPYKLIEPIQFGSETITELHFRKPRAKDLIGIKLQDSDAADILKLAGRLSGQLPVVIEEMSVEDLMEVAGIVMGFMPSGPRTGQTV